MGDGYYRVRALEELAAADRATDPAVSRVHREMARLYREAGKEGDGALERAAAGSAG